MPNCWLYGTIYFNYKKVLKGDFFVSKLSTYLKRLIADSGESISSLARHDWSERATFTRHLLMKRILSYKTVQALARHFNLRWWTKRFFQLYDILLQGEETYNNRQAVCRLLNNLLCLLIFPWLRRRRFLHWIYQNDLIKGEFAVRSAIRSVLIYEISHTENSEFSNGFHQA